MSAVIGDLLYPQVIMDVVSRVRTGQYPLGSWLNLHYQGTDGTEDVPPTQLIGPAFHESLVRTGAYNIFDRTRTVATFRPPGLGAAVWRPQPIGQVVYTIPRAHEKLQFTAEELAGKSPVMGPVSAIDQGGRDYLTMQEGHLGQRFNNAMEMMVAGLVRGKFYVKQVGDNWIPVITAPSAPTPFFTIDYKVPAGNQGQLDMLGAGAIIGTSWDNIAAPIISHDLPAIMEAYAQLTGMTLTDVFCLPSVWGTIMKNTEVINSGGSANTPFERFEFVREGKFQKPVWVAALRGYPTLRWHLQADYLVMDGGTDPSYAAGTGTLTPTIPAKSLVMMPEVSPEWIDAMWYSEMIGERDGQPFVKKPAWAFWSNWKTDPSVIEIFGLMNVLPRLRIPKALVTPQVIFP